MKNLNPIIPVPILIIIFSLAVLLMFIIWIRNKESRLKSTFGLLRRLAILALAFVIALRPMREERGADVQLSNLDVLFVLDTTLSMWADDAPEKTRFETARNDIKDIMDGLAGANFGLITFQNKSVVQSPFTQDEQTVLGILDTIQTPVSIYLTGSNIDSPYYDLESMLISSERKENRQTIVFFLSDGEVTHPGNTPCDYSLLGNMVDGGAVIGYGTDAGGLMRDRYGAVNDYDSDYDEFGAEGRAVSFIDENKLKEIADGLGIEYIHRERNTLLTPLISRIKASGDTITDKRYDFVLYYDTYYKYVPFLTGLLILELVIRIRENSRVLKKHGKKTAKKQKKE